MPRAIHSDSRFLAIILNTVLVLSPSIRNFETTVTLFGNTETLTLLDIAGITVFAIIMIMYTVTVINDVRAYSKADPKKK